MARHIAVKHTVPVWVVYDLDNGEVERVVGEDENLSQPIGFVPPDVYDGARGWMDDDMLPIRQLSPRILTQLREADKRAWPAWEWGW